MLVYVLVLAWTLAIGARLVYLQVFQAEKYRTLADDQQSGYLEISSRRGEIRDRRLEDLAISIRADSLYAQPTQIKKVVEAAQSLAPILGMKVGEVHKKLLTSREFVYLGRKLSDKVYYHHTGYIGGIKAQTAKDLLEKQPEKIIEKAVWGMLPKNTLGRQMFRKLKVYKGAEHPHKAQAPEILQ